MTATTIVGSRLSAVVGVKLDSRRLPRGRRLSIGDLRYTLLCSRGAGAVAQKMSHFFFFGAGFRMFWRSKVITPPQSPPTPRRG